MDNTAVQGLKKLGFRMHRASWVILVGFILLFAFDIQSTLSIGKLLEYVETNPLYIIGGWFPLIAMNFVALYILLRAYDARAFINRFNSINCFVWLSVLRISVIINNFKVGGRIVAGEITKEMVEKIPDAAKVSHHGWLIAAGILLPFAITMVIYLLFRLDHKVEANA